MYCVTYLGNVEIWTTDVRAALKVVESVSDAQNVVLVKKVEEIPQARDCG